MKQIVSVFLALCIMRSVRMTVSKNQDSCMNTDSLVVKTTSGRVEGYTTQTPLGKSVDVFLGIPYAASTSGANRFSPPKELPLCEDTLAAKSIPNSCSQGCLNIFDNIEDRFWISNLPESEDCLSLNIWAPRPRNSKLPVLVWIHGGGLQTGANNVELYNGAILASEEEIIVLNINYRLSAFGFLYFDHPEAPGNVGLMDQAAAFRWVQSNIEFFGGDPNKVTISGESAGGGSVGFHLLIPSSHGLFQRAILQSGNPITDFYAISKQQALLVSLELATLVGCASSDLHHKTDKPTNEIIECLKFKETSELQLALKNMSHHFLPFVPVVDDHYLPTHPTVLLKQRKYCHKSQIMLGSTKEDGLLLLKIMLPEKKWTDDTFFTDSELKNIIKHLVQTECDVLVNAVRFNYVDWTNPEDPVGIRNEVINLLTDGFICADNVFADQFSEHGNHVYKYTFNHKPSNSRLPKWTGCMHGDEIPFVFGVPLDPSKGFTEEEKAFSRNAMHYWANFVKYGDPNSGPHELFHWPRYTPHGKASLEIGLQPKVINGDRLRECAFWEHVFPGVKELCKSKNN